MSKPSKATHLLSGEPPDLQQQSLELLLCSADMREAVEKE